MSPLAVYLRQFVRIAFRDKAPNPCSDSRLFAGRQTHSGVISRRHAGTSSIRSKKKKKVTHGELHTLVAQDPVGAGHMIEEVGNRECDQKLATAGAHRATAVFDHDRSIESGFEITRRDLSEIRDRRIKVLVQSRNAFRRVRGGGQWRTQQMPDCQLGSLGGPVDLGGECEHVQVSRRVIRNAVRDESRI